MNDKKYIGLDVHLASISIAVLSAAGRLIVEATIGNQAAALVDFIQGLKGALHVALEEEGTPAEWLYGLLAPRVSEIVVCDPRRNPRRAGEKKSDRLDAHKLAEWLRLGSLKPVYHGLPEGNTLRELARSYSALVSDSTRVMSRLKALYRGRGIPCAGAKVYSPRFRSLWLEQLREPGARRRAELRYEQLDFLREERQKARAALLQESRRHPAHKILRSVPSIGPVRAALLLAWLRTPYRFRGKRTLWGYAGLALVTHSSADYRLVKGQLLPSRRPALILGLNANHHHGVKALFKDAAASALAHPGPLREFYDRRIAAGMRPELARLTLARKIAAIVLHLWKKGERFNAEYLKSQAA
jgi:transposase